MAMVGVSDVDGYRYTSGLTAQIDWRLIRECCYFAPSREAYSIVICVCVCMYISETTRPYFSVHVDCHCSSVL